MENIPVKSTTVRLITDKPVRKTPYQVKGVFMKQFPDEPIIPFLDGSLRDKYFYPRVQVKIINEQIYIVGIKEGIDSIMSLVNNLQSFNFGNITINIEKFDLEENDNQFKRTDNLFRYDFITPWAALNRKMFNSYKSLSEKEKLILLKKLIGQNLLFLAKELGSENCSKIYTDVKIDNMKPDKIEDNGWGVFTGSFQTNFILPNHIGLGNGITRGYGTLFSLNNPLSPISSEFSDEKSEYVEEKINEEDESLNISSKDDILISNKRKDIKKRHKPKKKKRYNKPRFNNKNTHSKKDNNKYDDDDDSKFNSDKYHQKQHDF